MRRLEYDGDLDFDLGNLMAAERGPIDQERFKSEPDTACREVATQITQSLIARLFQLPSEAIPVRPRAGAPTHPHVYKVSPLHFLAINPRWDWSACQNIRQAFCRVSYSMCKEHFVR